MTVVYVIMILGLLHNVESIVPGSFPDMNSCQTAAMQLHLTFGNWASCQPMSAAPAKAKHRHYK